LILGWRGRSYRVKGGCKWDSSLGKVNVNKNEKKCLINPKKVESFTKSQKS
jgi:hypothetical protein